jgi:FAD/FMN-containing dehydrogenase
MDQEHTSVVRELMLIPSLPVYPNSSPEFEHYCTYYNRALVDQPLAIVRPRTENEVSQIVQICSMTQTPLTIRSGGHDFFGRSLVVRGIVIDMRAIDSITITPDRTSVRVGGGVIAGALQEALAAQQLFTPTGQSKSVGYVSWACGGGYGFYVGTYGFGVDQVLGARVVVASGTVIDTDEDSELLWALRGAGAGSFGVVVELRVKVYTTPKLYAGYLAFPLSNAATVLESFKSLVVDDFPDEFSGDAIVAHPDMLPVAVSEPCLTFFWCWTAVDGDLASAKAFLQKMTGLGTVLANTVEESKFTLNQLGALMNIMLTLFVTQPVRQLTASETPLLLHSFAVETFEN